MSDKLTFKGKRDLAQTLFVTAGLSQKDIAVKVGVNENTITKWKKDDDWDALRAVTTISRAAQLKMFYNQINAINAAINDRNEGNKYASSTEADTLVKLSKTIKNLETEMGIADAVNFSMGLLSWIRSQSVEKAQEMTVMLDGYIKELQSKSA